MNDFVAPATANDRLIGANLTATWEMTTLTYTAGSRTVSFSGFDRLVGGTQADTFHFTDASAFTGVIDGAAGTDVVDYTGATNQVNTTITAKGTTDGFAGTTTGLIGTFDNIDVVRASTHGADTFTGGSMNATFQLDGSDRYQVDANTIAFQNYEILNGGDLVDTFRISGSRTYQLNGGMGDDVFAFLNGSHLTGTIDGNLGGANRIDLSAYTTNQTVYLTGSSLDGYMGTIDTILTGSFAAIDEIYGSSSATYDQLFGLDLAARWNVNGVNSSYVANSTTLSFRNFEVLQGGAYNDLFILYGAESGILFGNQGDDTFHMNNGSNLTGTIHGGGGFNLLDFSDYTTTVTVNLVDGTANHITSIDAVQAVYGGSANDTLIGNNGENTLKGNGGDDVMDGGDGDDIYLFDDNFGHDSITDSTGIDTFDFSTVTSTIYFNLSGYNLTNGSNSVNYHANVMERFIGGTADDTFYFGVNYGLPTGGWINGSGGSDWLDYQNYSNPVTVNLTTGFATGVPMGVINVENAIGGSAGDSLTGNADVNTLEGRDGDDTITGLAGNDILNGGNGSDTFIFSGNAFGNDTLIDASGSDTLNYTGATGNLVFSIGTATLSVTDGTNTLTSTSGNVIERLLGGTGNDTFQFADGATLAGGGTGTFIDGGAGNNTLDYTAYTSSVLVNLMTKLATGVNNNQPGGIDHIQNVMGGTLYNVIYGDDNDNILESGNTNDYLYGMGGNDTYIFYDNWGTDYVYDSAGNDTMIFNTSTGVIFTFYNGYATVQYGSNIVTTDGHVENFTGSIYGDQFIFKPNGSIAGVMNGRGGTDIVNLSETASAVNVTLTALGSVDGFNGTIAGLASFENMDNFIGSSFATDSLTGRNADAEFRLGATDQYISVNTLAFSSFENLNGGTAADTFSIQTSHTANLNGGLGDDSFVYSSGATLTGTINGAGGVDTLDLRNLTGNRNVTITGTGSVDGFNGTEAAVTGGWSNINNILAATGGADVLTGANQAARFELDATNRYVIGANSMTFDGFDSLIGGSAADTFTFINGKTFTGTLNGAGGTDWFDYSAYGSTVSYNMQTGTITGLTGAFSSIEGLIGSASAYDTITGANSGSIFNMTSAEAGNINGSFYFSSIENLIGGSGTDTLSYSGYGSAVVVNLETLSATGLISFSGMENLIGSSASDTITARNAGSSFLISGTNSGTADSFNFSSFENLTGMDGNDVFHVTAAAT